MTISIKYLATMFICLTVLVIACKKKKTEPQPAPTNPTAPSTYTMYQKGNYWIYEEYVIDTLGKEEKTGVTDSMYCMNDTMIHNATFHQFMHSVFGLSLERDSAEFLVNERGNIIMSTAVSGHEFEHHVYKDVASGDSFYFQRTTMISPDSALQVQAGIYHETITRQRETIVYLWRNSHYNIFNPVITKTVWAKNVGMIVDTYFNTGGPFTYQKRLVRYHLN